MLHMNHVCLWLWEFRKVHSSQLFFINHIREKAFNSQNF